MDSYLHIGKRVLSKDFLQDLPKSTGLGWEGQYIAHKFLHSRRIDERYWLIKRERERGKE
jgi:hypothetical protein